VVDAVDAVFSHTIPGMLNYAGKAGEASKVGNGYTAPLQLIMAQNMSALIVNYSK